MLILIIWTILDQLVHCAGGCCTVLDATGLLESACLVLGICKAKLEAVFLFQEGRFFFLEFTRAYWKRVSFFVLFCKQLLVSRVQGTKTHQNCFNFCILTNNFDLKSSPSSGTALPGQGTYSPYLDFCEVHVSTFEIIYLGILAVMPTQAEAVGLKASFTRVLSFDSSSKIVQLAIYVNTKEEMH